MTALSDAAFEGLRQALGEPDLAGTRYELAGVLGRGGMATVYRARDRTLDRDVALKVLDLPELESDERLAERMLREARVLAKLEHPGIVPVHDVGTLADGRVYCAMKLVAGKRLDEALPGLALAERLRLFLRLCETVAFAHANGVVHRDLKPQNVMVGAFGELLVVDWGLAKALDGDEVDRGPDAGKGAAPRFAGGTGEGWMLGTPGYMAPEQARGDAAAADARSDVYALGGVLHFVLAGAAPADDGPRLPAGAPRPLAAICRRALERAPAARYASALELAADIERFLDGRPVSVHRESVGERAARLFTRYQPAILVVVAYLLVRTLILLFAKL